MATAAITHQLDVNGITNRATNINILVMSELMMTDEALAFTTPGDLVRPPSGTAG